MGFFFYQHKILFKKHFSFQVNENHRKICNKNGNLFIKIGLAPMIGNETIDSGINYSFPIDGTMHCLWPKVQFG